MRILLAILILTLIGATVIFAPFSLVWAINELFELNNEYDFKSWLSSVIILAVIWLLKPTNAGENNKIRTKN
jgi:hypothetical protein